jgi:hypothetical protein
MRENTAKIRPPALLQVDVTILQQINGNPLQIATRLAFDCWFATPVPTLNGSADVTLQARAFGARPSNKTLGSKKL